MLPLPVDFGLHEHGSEGLTLLEKALLEKPSQAWL